MSEHPAIRDEELHSFIDNALDEQRRAEIAAIVSEDAILAYRVAQFRADKMQLANIYGELIERPVPKEWIARIERDATRSRPGISTAAIAAVAMTVLVLLGSLAAYRELAVPKEDNIIAEALAARNNAIRPQEVLSAGVAQESVLTAALGTRAKFPDLNKMGYRLAKFQIYPGAPGNKAVELVYRDDQNRTFTLYLRRASSPPRFDQFERDGVRVCIWQDDVLGTVMAGKMSAAEMQRLASLSYTGLTL
jgi:anti-sigma factor RsiW